MLVFLRVVYRLAIACWLGSMVFLAFVEAPRAFTTLPPQQAGALVGGQLWVLYPAALVAGLLAAACLAFRKVRCDVERVRGRAILLAVAIVLMASSLGIAYRMDALRQEAGGDIMALAPTASARVAFDHLHHATEGLMGVAILVVGGLVGLG